MAADDERRDSIFEGQYLIHKVLGVSKDLVVPRTLLDSVSVSA